MNKPEFLTVSELASRLRLAERTAYDLVRQGRIPGAAKIGGQWRIRTESLDAWLAAGGDANLKSPNEEKQT